MAIKQSRVRKSLNRQIMHLNEVIAELDGLLTELETDFYRVTIFGSARIDKSSRVYEQVYDLAFRLASRGIDVVTGGGPGLMEAANKGAKDGCKDSRSFGLSIDLPFEADDNSHLDVKRQHRRFSSRLDEFMRLSHAVVVTPGGIGTMLELFYTWQLLQVQHIKPRPVFLLGKKMWDDFIRWMREGPLESEFMSKEDLEMLTVVDSVDEIITYLDQNLVEFHKAKQGDK